MIDRRIPTCLVSLLLAACAGGQPMSEAEPLVDRLRAQARDEVAEQPDTGAWSEAGWQLTPIERPPLRDMPYEVILDPDRMLLGTLSLGNTSTGWLANGRSFPLEHQHLYVLSTHVDRQAHYGTDETIEIIETAAAALAERFPGTRVPLGDCSAHEGGDIRHHASHNSGRDLDIPFLVRSTSDRELTTTGFAGFDASGRTGRLVFDDARNWHLLRAVIEASEGTLQWAFVANWLKRRLLDYAIAAGEPKWIIARAADVMWQPGDSSPHDDHFHLRFYCSVDDRLEGCINTGPVWAWANHFNGRHEARVHELARGLIDGEVSTRVAVVDFLRRIDGRQTGTQLAVSLPHQPAEVQVAILDALTQFRTPGVGRHVVGLATLSDDPDVRAVALRTAASYPMIDAANELAALVHDCDTLVDGGEPRCRAAARALLDVQHEQIVPSLIEALDSPDDETRAIIAQVLARTTGRTSGINWLWAGASTRASAIESWRDWYEQHGADGRQQWLRQAFIDNGFEMPDELRSSDALHTLVDAIFEPEPLGYLATTTLRRITGAGSPPQRWRHSRQQDYWRNVVMAYEPAE